MVQVVMGFLDEVGDKDVETKLGVIETLRTVTEGKVSRDSYARERGGGMLMVDV